MTVSAFLQLAVGAQLPEDQLSSGLQYFGFKTLNLIMFLPKLIASLISFLS